MSQPLLKSGLHPDASDALRQAGVGAGRVGQTIGTAPASKGTHGADGTDTDGRTYTAATDLRINGDNFLSDGQVKTLIAKLSEVGFAAYFRNPGQDGWPGREIRHVHAVYAGCPMKRSLRNQVHDYLHGKNGLASHGSYSFFQPSPTAQNKVRALFLAHNQSVGLVEGQGEFLDEDLAADDAQMEAEYAASHDHSDLEDDVPAEDDLASTLAEC